jgi:hypothetical protein
MRAVIAGLTAGMLAQPVLAQQSAAFLGSATYATAEGCDKLKALAAGGDRNISTVPETLTASGYEGWEHSCRVTAVTETEPGKVWKVVTECSEGESAWADTQVFEKASDTSFKVMAEGEEEPTVFAVCDAPAAPKGN